MLGLDDYAVYGHSYGAFVALRFAIDYMERLKAEGIEVHYEVFEGCFHGFDAVAGRTSPARRACKLLMEQFKYAMEHHFAEQDGSK